jgi:hypothetical protein
MALQMKQMEQSAQRDREHAERLAEQARLDRESRSEATERRERLEREAREAADRRDKEAREDAERNRQRQHEMEMRRMEQERDSAREHQERLLQMTKMERQGGISGITEMLGMETPEVLAKIFGGGGEGEADGGWAEAIPKVLGAIAEVGAKTLGQKPPPGPQRRQAAPQVEGRQPKMIAIQTPDGVKMVPAAALARLRAAQAQPGIPVPRAPQAAEEDDDFVPDGLPVDAFEPDFAEEEAPPRRQASSQSVPAGSVTPELRAAAQVNPIKRAKASGMKFSEQRKARRAIRDLLPRLEKASEEEWVGVVTEALVKEPAIYSYLKAVSVYVALAEAKVAPDVAERTVREMKGSGLIPDEVPYDEADFKRLQDAEEADHAQSEADKLNEAPIPPSWPATSGEEGETESPMLGAADEGGDQ